MTENQTDAKDSIILECFEIAKNSEDPVTAVGACIVNQDGVIIGKGYNRMPRIKEGCEEKYPWEKKHDSSKDWLKSKYAYIVYAEMDAILKARCSVEDCTMYTLLYPGNESAKMIVESGIKELIYHKLEKQDKKTKGIDSEQNTQANKSDYCIAAETIFTRAGITINNHELKDEPNSFKISNLELETINRDEKKDFENFQTPET